MSPRDAPGVTIACPKCNRRVGIVAADWVDSAIGAVTMRTGKVPATRFLLGHRAAVVPGNRRACRFQKYVGAEWVDRALALAERTGRSRLVADEVDRVAA